MGASRSAMSSYAGSGEQQDTSKGKRMAEDFLNLLEDQSSEWQDDNTPQMHPFMAPVRLGRQNASEEKGEVVGDTTGREDRSQSPQYSPKSDEESDGEGESTKTTLAATAGEEGTRLPVAATVSQEEAATAPATAPTAKVPDAFTEALSSREGNTLLLAMWESGRPCEPIAFNKEGEQVEFDLLEVRTADADTKGKYKMVLSAWVGTDITRAERKHKSDFNYVVLIMKKEEVQTWKEVEIRLWKEYRRDWNTEK